MTVTFTCAPGWTDYSLAEEVRVSILLKTIFYHLLYCEESIFDILCINIHITWQVMKYTKSSLVCCFWPSDGDITPCDISLLVTNGALEEYFLFSDVCFCSHLSTIQMFQANQISLNYRVPNPVLVRFNKMYTFHKYLLWSRQEIVTIVCRFLADVRQGFSLFFSQWFGPSNNSSGVFCVLWDSNVAPTGFILFEDHGAHCGCLESEVQRNEFCNPLQPEGLKRLWNTLKP